MAEQTEQVGADTDHLKFFVDNGDRYLASLRLLGAELDEARSGVVAAVGEGPITEGLEASLSFGTAIEAAERCNWFVATIHDALTGTGDAIGLAGVSAATDPGGGSVRLRSAVQLDRALWEAGLLDPGDGSLPRARRDRLVALLLAGVPADSPIADLILTRRLVPPDDELRDAVAAAIGAGLTPTEAGIDPRYFPAAHRGSPVDGPQVDRPAPAGAGPTSVDPDRSRLLAIAATGAHLGRGWQGRTLAGWYAADRLVDPTAVTPGGYNAKTGLLLARQLTASSASAAAFFNTLGARGTAELPSLNPADGRLGTVDRNVVQHLSTALAAASRTGELTFSGRELIDQHDEGYGAPHVSLLFTAGDFDHRFLVDATITQLERHPNGDRLLGTDVGRSATNLLLERAAESRGVGEAVVEELGPDGTAIYLTPARAFSPTESGTHPITGFLAEAGRSPTAASIILAAAAADGVVFSDPGVAGGVDAVMGRHATVMYSTDHLRHRGVSLDDRLSQENWRDLGFDGEQWKLIRSRVLEHGMGGGLAAGNNALIFQAIGHDLADGDLSDDLDFYTLMAGNSGALDEQWFQRVLEISEQLDADGATKNGYAAAGLSVGLAIGSAYALPMTAAGAAGGVIVGTGASLGLARRPINYWDTDLTNTELRRRLTDQRQAGRVWQEAVIAPAVTAAASAGHPVRTTSGNVLTIEHEDGNDVLIATNPTTGERNASPAIRWHPDGRVGDARNDTAGQIHEHFIEGQRLIDPAAASPSVEPPPHESSVADWISIPRIDGDEG